MLRDRYALVDLFALVPAWELRFEPELAELDRLLEDDLLFQQVKPLTLFSSLKSLRLRLWDEPRRKLVGYSHLRELRKQRKQHAHS